MKNKLTLICFLYSLASVAQSPGGIGVPTFWLRGTAGTSTTTNNAANATWTSAGSVAASVTQATAANQPLYRNGSGTAAPIASSTNVFNYNPYLIFDGVNDNLASTTSYDFGSSSSSGAGITQLAVVRPNNTAGIVYFEWNGLNAMIKCKSDGPQCLTDGFGSFGTNNQYNLLNNTLPKIQHIIGFDNGLLTNSAGPNGFCGYDHIPVTTTASNDNPSGSNADRTNVGCNVNTGEFSNTSIAEIMIFNRNITLAEMLRVNSFLGIKYGITLGGNGTPTNYTNSAGTTIWNGATAAYHNNVIGISRDDNSGLLQKQSHTNDDTVRIYLATLAATNAANAGSFTANNAHVLIGGTTGRLCTTAASLAEMPTGLASCTLYSRIAREWRVQRTNMTQTFNLDVKLAACANLTSVNVADLRLLVDDDGNFANGGTSCYYNGDGTGIVFSYTNPVVTITGISTTHIPNNAFRFITIASVNAATPLPVSIKEFYGACNTKENEIDFSWNVEDESNIDYYAIDGSHTGEEWETLQTIPSNGQELMNVQYSTQWKQNGLPYAYYRISSIDFDGSRRYVSPISLNCLEKVILYPNPTKADFNIVLPAPKAYQLKVFNGFGQLVFESELTNNSQVHSFSMLEYQAGTYFIELIGPEETLHFQLNYLD